MHQLLAAQHGGIGEAPPPPKKEEKKKDHPATAARTEPGRHPVRSECRSRQPGGGGYGTAERHGGTGTGVAPLRHPDHEEAPAVRQGGLLRAGLVL